MKKNPRSKSFTSKSSGTSSPSSNSNTTRAKLKKRNSAPVATITTPTSSEGVEKEKTVLRRKKGQVQKEEISEEVDKVIDLSRNEDVEQMMIQLVKLLGIDLPTNEGSSIFAENYYDEISLRRRKIATITRPELSQITDYDRAKGMPVRNSKKFLEGFSDSKGHTISYSSQRNRLKLPNIKDSGRQLFQVSYTSPTGLNKVQQSQPRPRSLSVYTNRGMDFANERYRYGCDGSKSHIFYRSSRIDQTYPIPHTGTRRNNPTSGTGVYRSILARGKQKTERFSRVTFVDDKQYDLLRNDSRGKQGQILHAF